MSNPPSSNTPQPGAGAGGPGAPPPGEVFTWLKFVWASLSQVKGFVPKMKAIGRIITILKNR
jgi:hypothetical protein